MKNVAKVGRRGEQRLEDALLTLLKSFIQVQTAINLHISDKVSTLCGTNHFAQELLIPIHEIVVRTCIFSTPSGRDH